MPVLVVAEHDNARVAPATLHTAAAARKIDPDVHLAVLGSDCASVLEAAAKIHGVKKVLASDSPVYAHFLAEALAPAIVAIADRYSHILFPATSFGKNLAPRIAAALDVQQISEIVSVESPDTFRRPIYAGNAIATVRSSDRTKIVTVRTTAFEALKPEGGQASRESLDAPPSPSGVAFVKSELSQSMRPELGSARIVVSGGRALGSAENFKMIEALADKLGAAIGASRAAVDAGYAPNDLQVGQTGKVVAPELYIAIGISGAIQHLAGMKDSKVIVAINKDPEAPIFQIADYGLAGDLFAIVPELTGKL